MRNNIFKNIIGVLALALIVSGCSAGNTNQSVAIHQDEYAAILPYESSDMTGKHIGLISDMDIRTMLESGLMDLSKSYFSVNDVGYKTHVFLDYDELDATDGSRGLLGTLRDDNPNGLNPGSSEEFDTGNGIAVGPLLLVDLYEVDFYRNDALAGISIGLAVEDSVEIDGERVEITEEKMQEYLKVTCSKLVSYLRSRFNEITSDIPILVAAYQLNTDSADSSKGGYIYSAYFNGSSTDYKTIQEEYVIVPGTLFSSMDATTASEFSQFKSDIATVLPDNTYTTGQARFVDGTCVSLKLYVTAHGKTVGQIMAVLQSIKEKLGVFTSLDMEILVEVENNNEICALMYRAKNSRTVDIITTI